MDPRKLRAFYYVGKYGRLLTEANYLKVSPLVVASR